MQDCGPPEPELPTWCPTGAVALVALVVIAGSAAGLLGLLAYVVWGLS